MVANCVQNEEKWTVKEVRISEENMNPKSERGAKWILQKRRHKKQEAVKHQSGRPEKEPRRKHDTVMTAATPAGKTRGQVRAKMGSENQADEGTVYLRREREDGKNVCLIVPAVAM